MTGTYIYEASPGNNFFDPAYLETLGTGQEIGVPTGYGNEGGFQDIPIDPAGSGIEFGFNSEFTDGLPITVSLDITQVPSGYSVTWTTDLCGLTSLYLPATITLTSGAFEACTAISKDTTTLDNIPAAIADKVTGSLQDDQIFLNTPFLDGSVQTSYTATWLVGCRRKVSLDTVNRLHACLTRTPRTSRRQVHSFPSAVSVHAVQARAVHDSRCDSWLVLHWLHGLFDLFAHCLMFCCLLFTLRGVHTA